MQGSGGGQHTEGRGVGKNERELPAPSLVLTVQKKVREP